MVELTYILLMEQLHTVEQAAHLLQLHPDTIRLWLRSGRLRGRKLGRVWRVPDEELRRLGQVSDDEAKNAMQDRSAP